MDGNKKEKQKRDQLIGIKAIAEYLNMSVRNVYLWKKKLGLPVHRVSGRSGYRIYAYKEEIDLWLKDKDVEALKGSKHKKIPMGLIVSISVPLLILMSFLFILLFRNSAAESTGPALYSVDGNIVYVKNSKGDILWNFAYGGPLPETDLKDFLDTDNIDNDAPNELVACTYDSQEHRYGITLFDHDGRIIWKRGVTSQHTFNKIDIEDSYRSSCPRFAKTKNNEIFVITRWTHTPRFLSIITGYDLKGNLVSQYHHTGHLTHLLEAIDLDGDGNDELVFTGTNNLLNNEGIVGVLPAKYFHGTSPPYHIEPEYSQQAFRLKNYIADEVVRGNQLLYIRFKRTGLLSEHKTPIIDTEVPYYSDSIIQIELYPWIIKKESGYTRLGFAYLFDRNFTLKDVITQTDNLEKYQELLEKDGHGMSLEELVKAYSKIVYRWVPESESWVPVKSSIAE